MEVLTSAFETRTRAMTLSQTYSDFSADGAYFAFEQHGEEDATAAIYDHASSAL
jgi:predicted secreted protein